MPNNSVKPLILQQKMQLGRQTRGLTPWILAVSTRAVASPSKEGRRCETENRAHSPVVGSLEPSCLHFTPVYSVLRTHSPLTAPPLSYTATQMNNVELEENWEVAEMRKELVSLRSQVGPSPWMEKKKLDSGVDRHCSGQGAKQRG